MWLTRLMISNRPEPAPRTNKAKRPTWGQLKKLTIEGEESVKEQGQPLTSATLAFDLGYLVLGYVLCGNYVWQYITKKVGRQQ